MLNVSVEFCRKQIERALRTLLHHTEICHINKSEIYQIVPEIIQGWLFQRTHQYSKMFLQEGALMLS